MTEQQYEELNIRIDTLDAKLNQLLTLLAPKPSKPPKLSGTWKTLVKMTLDEFDVKDEDVPYNQAAEEAIRFLKDLAQVKFTPTVCEAIVASYPAVQTDGDLYIWATDTGYGNAQYEILTDELNTLYNEYTENHK